MESVGDSSESNFVIYEAVLVHFFLRIRVENGVTTEVFSSGKFFIYIPKRAFGSHVLIIGGIWFMMIFPLL
jgi:hypothetical protein